MTRVAICDDEPNIRKLIASYVRRQHADCAISEYASGKQLLDACRVSGEQPHILFLDIAFPGGVDGVETAKQLRALSAGEDVSSLSALPLIIFVTGDADSMPDAFRVHAFQYIVKPFNEADFAEILSQALRELRLMRERASVSGKKITIRSGGAVVTLARDDVFYLESAGRKLMASTAQGRVTYYGKIVEAEAELGRGFFRIHRGFLVNLEKIRRYTRTEAELVNGEKIPISKQKYPQFVETYMQYIAGGG